MMLITPAIASEPYCAAAPSCSTSMWSMAATGMKFKSAAAPPWYGPPSTARLAVPWRRLPLTSTSVSFGLRPRKRADSVLLAASPPMAGAGQRSGVEHLHRRGAVLDFQAAGAGAGDDHRAGRQFGGCNVGRRCRWYGVVGCGVRQSRLHQCQRCERAGFEYGLVHIIPKNENETKTWL